MPAPAPARASARRRRQTSLPVPLWVLAVAASVVVVVVLAVLSNHQTLAELTNTIAPPNGASAPDFSFPASDGTTYSLAQFCGKPVLVEFMAPWCSHCQAEAPMFNQIHDTYQARGVQMLGVSASPYGHTYDQTNSPPITLDDMKWFSTTYSVTYPLLFDRELKAGNAYAIAAYPPSTSWTKPGRSSRTLSTRSTSPP